MGVGAPHPEHHAPALGVLDPVPHEVEQDLPQPIGVALHPARHGLIHVADQLQALAVRVAGQHRHRVLGRATRIQARAPQLDGARVQLAEVEELVDQGEQGRRRTTAVPRELPLLAVQAGAEQQLGHAQHPVEGGAQLVGDPGQELALGLGRRLGPLPGLVQLHAAPSKKGQALRRQPPGSGPCVLVEVHDAEHEHRHQHGAHRHEELALGGGVGRGVGGLARMQHPEAAHDRRHRQGAEAGRSPPNQQAGDQGHHGVDDQVGGVEPAPLEPHHRQGHQRHRGDQRARQGGPPGEALQQPDPDHGGGDRQGHHGARVDPPEGDQRDERLRQQHQRDGQAEAGDEGGPLVSLLPQGAVPGQERGDRPACPARRWGRVPPPGAEIRAGHRAPSRA